MKLLRLSFLCSLLLSVNSFVVQAQTDDFDDGNDDGWARVNTLAGQGVPATWGFPNNNSYSIAMAGNMRKRGEANPYWPKGNPYIGNTDVYNITEQDGYFYNGKYTYNYYFSIE